MIMATVTCKSFVHDVDKVRFVRDKLPSFLHQEIVLSYHASHAPMHKPLVVVPAPQETLSRLPAPIGASLWPLHHPNTHLWVFNFNHDFQSFRCTVYKACKRSWCWGFSCACFLCQGLPPVRAAPKNNLHPPIPCAAHGRHAAPPSQVKYRLLWRPLQHLAKISTILGPRSGLMDGTENLNGNLPSLPEILEGNRKKSQAYENYCKPVWKMRNPQWKPRQSKGTLETDRKQIGKTTKLKKTKKTRCMLQKRKRKSHVGTVETRKILYEPTKPQHSKPDENCRMQW